MNILKCASVSLLFLPLCGCGGGNPGNGLTGRVTLEGYEGRPVYLETVSSAPSRVDSALVRDGRFSFTLEDSVPRVYHLVLGTSEDDPYAITLPVVSEKGAVRVSMGEFVLTAGTPLNDSLQDFLLAVSNFTDKAMKMEEPDISRVKEDFGKLVEGAVMQNIRTPVGVYIYRMYGSRLTEEQQARVMSRADEEFRKAVNNN